MVSASSIYFNPNLNPEYFYPLIKPLTILYDQIYIWSPVQKYLEDYDFSSIDFLKACSGVLPAIVPLGRESWFDLDKRIRRVDYLVDAQPLDRSFEKQLASIARQSKLVLPNDSYAPGYKALDEAWASKERQLILERVAQEVLEDLPTKHRLRIYDVARQENRPFEWATMNSFVQDINAKRYTSAQAILVKPQQLGGYVGLSEPSAVNGNDPQERNTLSMILQRVLEANVNINETLALEIVSFLRDSYSIDRRSWKEVEKLRTYRRKLIAQYVNTILETIEKNYLGISIIDITRSQVKDLIAATNKDILSAIEKSAYAGAAAVMAGSGFTITALLAIVPLIVGWCLRQKVHAELIEPIARLRAGKRKAELIETTYFAEEMAKLHNR